MMATEKLSAIMRRKEGGGMIAKKDRPFIPGLEPEAKRQRISGLSMHRFFLAVKPDAAAIEQANEVTLRLMRENGLVGTPLKPKNLHISLPMVWEGAEFPNDIAETVSARVQAVRMPPFEIILDMAMSFRQPKRYVLVLGTTRSIANLYGLNRQLVTASGSKARGSSFNPHMTLLYADRPVEKQPVEPVRWMAGEFVLIHSYVGLGRHETVGRWPLR